MRLIDADALEKRMYVIPYYDNRDEDAVIDEIYKAPTVDAVEVCRCGECKFKSTKGCLGDTIVCENLNHFYSTDHACNEGERKESEVRE